jgi:glycosyltransferase involved in cell wall biosynthesis
MTYRQARIKQSIEQAAIFPLVLLGRFIGIFYRINNPGGYFFVFPNRDTGGSYKVNADLANLVKDKKPVLLFTKHERNGGFRHLFEIEGAKIIDLSSQIDNKWLHFINIIWRGIIASSVNRCTRPVLFGGECIYFYKLLPHVAKKTWRVELCHVNIWLNYTQAFIPFIDKRIFSTEKIRRDHEHQYQQNRVPKKYFERLVFIDNKIPIPEEYWPAYKHVSVLFVGRGAPQKRACLVAEIAKRVIAIRPQIKFTMIGDVLNVVPDDVKKIITIRTDIADPKQLIQFYKNNNVLILTSLFEGLPIVVMDMMAQGRVVLSTAVDGIPDYLKHMQTGVLINEVKDEKKLINQAVDFILMLDDDEALVKRLSANARAFALSHFSAKVFDDSYKKMLLIN